MMTIGGLKKLYEKGLALHYLHEKSKRPIDTAWTKGPRKSWDELEASFEKRYNVGVRLGSASKLITGKYLGVIDCDVKSKTREAKREMNEELRKLGIDLNSAPIVISGRGNGSKHVYIQTDKPMTPMTYAKSKKRVKVMMPSVKPSKSDLEALSPEEIAEGYRMRPAWEISFMGEGQQTVLPPSIHPDSGMRYDWASPLTVKYMPTFKPEKFVSQVEKKDVGTLEFNFKAEDVNLYETSLPIKWVKLIEEGQGSVDRSADLFAATLAMCRAGFTDNQILSVLSDEDNWLSSAAYDHTQSQSRLRAVKWLHKYTLTKARYETDIMRRFENKPKHEPLPKREVEAQEKEITEVTERVLPDLDGQKKPKPTVRNIMHILEVFFGGGLVGHDEFANRVVFLKDTPYGGKRGQEVSDKDDLALMYYIACHYRFEPSQESCYKAHSLVSAKYAFNPVRDYLDSLKWDGKPRLDTWLIKAFGAKAPPGYLDAVSRKVLVAAVARIYEPGCKYDYMAVLEGFQGKGKSMALRNLCGDKWFTDSLGDIYQKDVVDQMSGKWIIEFAELSSIKKSDVEFTKAFVSRQVDRVRLPYGRRSGDFPRQSIFIGTTNDSEYLTDETGNRRYWPVKITEIHQRWVRENRDQLWAEAKMRYDLGEPLYLEKEIEEIARKEQRKRYQTDEWQSEIIRLITANPERKYTSTQIWREIQNTPMGHPADHEAKRIAKIMRHLGYFRTTFRIDGALCKGWRKSYEM